MAIEIDAQRILLAEAEQRLVVAEERARATAEAATRIPREAALRAEIDAAELELEALEAEDLEAVEVRAVDVVEAEITTAEEELMAVGARVAEVVECRRLEKEALAAELAIEGTKSHLADLVGRQAQLVERVKGVLEKQVSEIFGEQTTIDLEDEQQNPICRFRIGGVDIGTISDGEVVRFSCGIVAALLRSSAAAWRPLLVDRIEAVSMDRRPELYRRVVGLVEEGILSQVVLAGCPDTSTELPGMLVVNLSGGSAR